MSKLPEPEGYSGVSAVVSNGIRHREHDYEAFSSHSPIGT
jgi:hypothetical protein